MTLTLEHLRESVRKVRKIMDAVPFASGYKIMEDEFLCDKVQTRFPRSKKKRVRKKWSKRLDNFSFLPSKQIYVLNSPFHPSGPAIVCHPVTAAQIRRSLATNKNWSTMGE